jgi:hypothetical protein
MGGFQMRPRALFEFGSVALNPSPNGGVIHPEVSLLEKRLDLALGKGVSQPTSGQHRELISGAKWRHLKIGPSAMIVGW